MKRPSRGKIKVLFFESGRQGGSVFRLLSIMQRVDPSRFEVGVVSYYRDKIAARLFEVRGLFCRRSLRVPWYPQPDSVKLVLGLPVPTPFGVYLFIVSLLVLWRHRPDIAYMNSGIDVFGPTILAARLLGTKVVCHLRSSRELNPYELRLVPYANHVVTSSEWAARFYRDQARGRAVVTCVYEAIDLNDFDARAEEELESPLPDGPVYVCQVGSLVARKRPHLAIEAFAIARHEVPRLKLILAGAGPLQSELETMIRQRGLEREVLLLGYRRDIPALLRSSHIGLLLSEDEGLPNSVLEYMASSRPVVIRRLPFIDELIRDQSSGLVIDQVTPQGVAEAIVALARSAQYRERLGMAGRRTIESGPFHADREARDIEMLLTRVAEATEPRQR
jgi:glycosyltransferase involved in cell wall biosynthesis